MKLLFITNVVNRLDFLEFQYYTLNKFCENEFQFCVIDDSSDINLSFEFQRFCLENEISYYKKPSNNFLNPADACADAIQWTYENIIQKVYPNYLIFYIDSDMFLIDSFNFDEKLNNEFLGGVKQIRDHIVYPWNGLMFLNMEKINKLDPDLNFRNTSIDGVLTDVGGGIHYYLKKHNIQFYSFDTVYPKFFDNINLHKFQLTKGFNFELHYKKKFLHFRAGTNWQLKKYWKKENYKNEKDEIFKKIKNKTIKNNSIINNFSDFKVDNANIDVRKKFIKLPNLISKMRYFLKKIIRF